MSYNMDKIFGITKEEVGYLEKRSNSQLYDKTANAGSNNYTKYWQDIKEWGLGNYQAQYWCAAFIYWCFAKAYGVEAAKQLLLHAPYISCETLGTKAKAAGCLYDTPKAGDVVLFYNGNRFYHTGMVYKTDGTKFYTREGNTSGGSTVIANGGGVVEKSYGISAAKTTGHKFMRPAYGVSTTSSTSNTNITASTITGTGNGNVSKGKKWLNDNYGAKIKTYCGAALVVNETYDAKARAAALSVWKDLMNRKYGTSLTPGNINFAADCKKAAANALVKVNTSGTFTYLVELILSAKGYYTGAMDGACGSMLVNAVKVYQKDHKLTVDGICGANTWFSLFNT